MRNDQQKYMNLILQSAKEAQTYRLSQVIGLLKRNGACNQRIQSAVMHLKEHCQQPEEQIEAIQSKIA